MKESYIGVLIILFGTVAMVLIFLFQNITNTDQQNYTLLKETTEAAMYDSLDLASYRIDGTIKIDKEKFVENFIRRFAETASLSHVYKIDIYDIVESPPKVSIKVSTSDNTTTQYLNQQTFTFDVVNHIDAILETKY